MSFDANDDASEARWMIVDHLVQKDLNMYLNPIYMGFLGGRERMGGAESAHPHQNVQKYIYPIKSM